MAVLTKHRRTYTLDGSRVELWRSLRRGSLIIDDVVVPVEVTSFRRLAVSAGAVRLGPSGAMLPDGPAGWEVTRRSVSVVRDGARIDVREEGFLRKTTTVDVTGEWADRELIVLTAAFALLARQRRRRMIMIVAAASNHG
ncbi:hypothetical protein [Cryptosporangium arvum]|uniref:Uncharacterized protein n=1 Tax=Cryptosporangium arvum DSM 44712 TaxID=927661 RepID=A0A010ZMF3_9ACTN|nr:hypothetical protein [Cryptosporangium arvum]EXG79839.1 hypothetical protein CryarDRAFT_0885 [Cryptosporangium arvum DSM 44712]